MILTFDGKHEHHCDQIGLLLKGRDDKFSYKVAQKFSNFWGHFVKENTVLATFRKKFDTFIPTSGHTDEGPKLPLP